MTCSVKGCRRTCRPRWAICDQHVLEMVAPIRRKEPPLTEAEARAIWGDR